MKRSPLQRVPVVGLVLAALTGWCARRSHRALPRVLWWALSVVFGWFGAAGLVASWWVYEASELRRWRWLSELLPLRLRRYLVVAPRDMEFGPELREVTGSAHVTVVPPESEREWTVHKGLDAVLVVFAADDLPEPADRERFFEQARRTLREDGRIVVVEQHRGPATTAVFGPVAWRLPPRTEWERAATAAGLRLVAARRVTPFVTGLAFTPLTHPRR
ncbi:hypothetical protein [Allokutzneria sp. NRRL B-24872]|uniref:hypothetical protein n=1 Tax=Allokutzneria sp. NRRL B-24872 TaxID=1137961 RepID=UPI001177489E|nr:hypothetical protein [Allokutzneria sp. NRRL B-24872]